MVTVPSEVGNAVTDVKPDWVFVPAWMSNEVTAAGAVAASSEDRMIVETVVFVFIFGLRIRELKDFQ